MVVAVAEYEDFVIYCYFRPLFGQNGGTKFPFFHCLFYFKGTPWRHSEKGGGCTVEADQESQF